MYLLTPSQQDLGWFRSTRGQLGCPLRAYGPACNAEWLRHRAELRLRHRNAETAFTFGIRPLGQSTRSAGGHCRDVERCQMLMQQHKLAIIN